MTVHGITHHTNQGSYLYVGVAATKKYLSSRARITRARRFHPVYTIYRYGIYILCVQSAFTPHFLSVPGSLKLPWRESLVVGTGGVVSFTDRLSSRATLSVPGSEMLVFAVAAVSPPSRHCCGDPLAALLLL